MRRNPSRYSLLAALACLLIAQVVPAQDLRTAVLTRVDGERAELQRLSALGDSSAEPFSTLRAPSRGFSWSDRHISYNTVAAELLLGRNSTLPYGFNDGAVWQGRGNNLRALFGVAASYGPLHLIVAPEYLISENLPYQTIAYAQNRPEKRSVWANPFHPAPEGLDLPSRFGDQSLHALVAGQSSLMLRFPKVEVGVATENNWWGPGLQNALLWSSQGSGVPTAFVRTAKPLPTRFGTFDAWYTIGDLRESDFFDRDSTNNHRSLGAFALTWRPRATKGVEFGLARLVILAHKLSGSAITAPFASVGRPNTSDSLAHRTRDQITSLWARWAPPGSGFEAWTEWARFEEPASLRDLLESPGHSQGYTVGLQWARPVRASTARVYAEATYLEPSPSLRLRPVGTTYISKAVAQGFTVRGQPLGAGIGPGSSSQWAGFDWLRPRWRAGTYIARVRWDNAVVFTPIVPNTKYEDVSLINGVRVGGERWGWRLLLDWSHMVRLNYLFQAYNTPLDGRTKGIDLVNDALTLTLSTALHRNAR